MNTFKVETEVSASRICDQIITAIEGGTGYWLGEFKLRSSEITPTKRPWYSDPALYKGAFEIVCRPAEEADFDEIILTPERINSGLSYVAQAYPSRLAEILNEDGDAETADVFLQACLFGEVVYG